MSCVKVHSAFGVSTYMLCIHRCYCRAKRTATTMEEWRSIQIGLWSSVPALESGTVPVVEVLHDGLVHDIVLVLPAA